MDRDCNTREHHFDTCKYDCRQCNEHDGYKPYKQTKGEDKVKDDNLYLIPFYEEWDGSTDACYITKGRAELDALITDDYKDELGKTFQVYKLVPAFKVKLGLKVEILDEQYFF